MQGYDFKEFSYYYYGLLNNREKECYKKMLLAILALEPSVVLSYRLTIDELGKVIEFICHDRPDIFWFYAEHSYTHKDSKVYEVIFTYRMSKDEVESTKMKMVDSIFFKQLDQLIESKNTPFEKALVVFESIIDYADYDSEALGNDWKVNNYAYNVDGMILERKGVCAGYSKLFQYFLNRHKIFCTYVTGKTTDGGRHAWNLINLDNRFYYVDVTWGDPVFSNNCIKPIGYIGYDQFCMSTSEFNKTHNVVLENKMPLSTATRYNYYRYFNMIADAYSISDVASRMAAAYNNEKNNAVVVYSNEVAYLAAKRDLFNNAKIHDAFSLVKKAIASFDSGKVTYDCNDVLCKITFYFNE